LTISSSNFSFLIIVKRRKRIYNETTNGNVFVCTSNPTGNSNNESVVFVNNTGQTSGIKSPLPFN
jgi:hypothetical protein